jgi:hypothetical protein
MRKFNPAGAHLGGKHGGASEAGLVKKAQQRLRIRMPDNSKVDASIVRKFIREVTLNDKFRGTWVAEGLNDESTQTSLARKLK